MISDKDIWRAALLMMKRYGADAATQAAMRANALLAESGAGEGAAVMGHDRRSDAALERKVREHNRRIDRAVV